MVGLTWLMATVSWAQETPKLTVIEKGAKPRVKLELRPEVPSSQTIDFTMATTMGGAMPAVSVPPIRMGMRLDAQEQDGDRTRYTYEVTEVEIVGATDMGPALEEALAPMVGINGSAWVDTAGATSGMTTNFPPGVPPQMQSEFAKNLELTTIVFPSQKVGVGAKWKTDQDITRDGMMLHQTAAWTLVSVEGSKAVFDVAIQQSAPTQNLELAELPPGATMELTSLSSKGAGRTEIDLTKVSPVSSNMSMSMDMAMKATGPDGSEMPMSMSMTIDIDLVEPRHALTRRDVANFPTV